VASSSKTLKTKQALLRKPDVTQSTIGRILREEVDPQSGKLDRLAKAFGLSLAQLAELGQHPPLDPESSASPTAGVLIAWLETDVPADIECALREALVCRDERQRAQDAFAGVEMQGGGSLRPAARVGSWPRRCG